MSFLNKFRKTDADDDLFGAQGIPEGERQYYRPDDYYQSRVFVGTPFEKDIVRYGDRIKTAKPTPEGLYPPEIVAIHFCHSHPGRQHRYPSWYWFKYGIRDVGGFQRSLETKGFIEKGDDGQWRPTERGTEAVESNYEIIYAHQHLNDNPIGDEEPISAWNIQEKMSAFNHPNTTWTDKLMAYFEDASSRFLREGDTSRYCYEKEKLATLLETQGKKAEALKIREEIANFEVSGEIETDIHTYRADLAKEPELCAIQDEVLAQTNQLGRIHKAQIQYERDGDLPKYIRFWEEIWEEGILVRGGIVFSLIDLYIKDGSYEKALTHLRQIRKMYPDETDRVEKYKAKIQKLKR